MHLDPSRTYLRYRVARGTRLAKNALGSRTGKRAHCSLGSNLPPPIPLPRLSYTTMAAHWYTSIIVLGFISVISILSDWDVLRYSVLRTSTVASDATFDARPTGLRLVLLGDSITRYQYLSLAYFLRHGKWLNPDDKPNLVNQRSFMKRARAQEEDKWRVFLNETNQLLRPMEYCDCFRASWPNVKAVDANVMENRYFHDPIRNNSVAYIQAFGNTASAMHGRVMPQDAFRNIGTREFTHVNSTWQWYYHDWGDAIEHYVAQMNVTHVMMNAGLWPNDFHEAARESIMNALSKTNLVGIWRTNTYMTSRELRPSSKSADEAMVGMFGDNVLDVSWTRKLQTRFYWDDKHFLEPVYRAMNEELLQLVGYDFPPNYKGQNLTELFESDVILGS